VLKLRFPNTEHIEAFLPVTGDDHTSVVMEYSGRNSDGWTEQTRVAKLPDDMLARCLYDTYSRFATETPQLSDLAFNRKVIDVMDRAQSFARIRRWRHSGNGQEWLRFFTHPGTRPFRAPLGDGIEAGRRRHPWPDQHSRYATRLTENAPPRGRTRTARGLDGLMQTVPHAPWLKGLGTPSTSRSVAAVAVRRENGLPPVKIGDSRGPGVKIRARKITVIRLFFLVLARQVLHGDPPVLRGAEPRLFLT
jgi:hypothetical protein